MVIWCGGWNGQKHIGWGGNEQVSCQILIKLKRHQNFQLQMQSYALIFCKLLNQNLVRLSYFENLKIWNPILSEYFGKYIYLKSDLIWNFLEKCKSEIRSDPKFLEKLKSEIRSDPKFLEKLKSEIRSDPKFLEKMKSEIRSDLNFLPTVEIRNLIRSEKMEYFKIRHPIRSGF